jgi:hypothetical protein
VLTKKVWFEEFGEKFARKKVTIKSDKRQTRQKDERFIFKTKR